MKALKSARIVAASLGVLAFGAMAASPAMAFDKVDWKWKAYVDTHVDIDADIQLHVCIDGMVQVEKLQIFLGNVTADSDVSHITNTPFYPVVEQPKKDDRGGYPSVYSRDDHKDPVQTYAIDNGYRGKHDFDKIGVAPLDAKTQLPIVLSSATAIGNNQSITSDVPVFLHDGQFVANVAPEYQDTWSNPEYLRSSWGGGLGGNTNTELAVLFTLGAAFGYLTPAEISADSHVYDIKNASVDSSATAVANNISVNLAAKDVKNHVLIGDITQFALANVSATSDVRDVSATGYTDMRKLTTDTLQTIGDTTNVPVSVPTPWISSVATAIGNNASITVGPVLKNH